MIFRILLPEALTLFAENITVTVADLVDYENLENLDYYTVVIDTKRRY